MGRKILFFLFIGLTAIHFIQAQTGSVGIGTNNPHNSAALEIQSNSKGLLLSRMTTAQRTAIVSPAPGLLVFDTEKNCLFLYDGGGWQALAILGGNNYPLNEKQASDGQNGNAFGATARISGDYAIVGAPSDDINSNSGQGSAYIFIRQGGNWVEQAKLIASDGAVNDNFGLSVAISGEFAIVGAPLDDVFNPITLTTIEDRGSVYLFRRTGTTWSQFTKLTGTDPGAGDFLGSGVAISGNYAIAGAPNDDNGSNNSQGSAYVYFFNGTSWVQQVKLVASDGAGSDFFGRSVSISGDDLVVGSPGFNNYGAVYYYFRFGTTWLNQSKIEDDFFNRSPNDNFGHSVCLSGTRLMVGAYLNDISINAVNHGAVFFFEKGVSTWNYVVEINAPDGEINDRLGSSVSFSGDYAIAGASGDDSGAYTDLGSVYILKKTGTTWGFLRKIEITGNGQIGGFGREVWIDGLNLVIASSSGSNTKGRVYFQTLE